MHYDRYSRVSIKIRLCISVEPLVREFLTRDPLSTAFRRYKKVRLVNFSERKVAGDRCRGRGWPGAAAPQTHTGDAPIAPSSFIAMPLSQLVVRSLASHDRSESSTVETATALLPLATQATLPISTRKRAWPIRVALFDTPAKQHVIHVSSSILATIKCPCHHEIPRTSSPFLTLSPLPSDLFNP